MLKKTYALGLLTAATLLSTFAPAAQAQFVPQNPASNPVADYLLRPSGGFRGDIGVKPSDTSADNPIRTGKNPMGIGINTISSTDGDGDGNGDGNGGNDDDTTAVEPTSVGGSYYPSAPYILRGR